jgi:N-methylhydantoinase A
VRLSGPRPDLKLGMSAVGGDPSRSLKGERQAYFPELGGYHSTPVYDRYKLVPGEEVRGPAIVEERESTVVIGPGGSARVDDVLSLIVELV